MIRKPFGVGVAMTVLLGTGTAFAWTQGSDKPVKFRLVASLSSLDWEQTTNLRDMKVWHQMYEGLYGMDEAKNGYYPELAKKVDLSKNGLVYTITLQNGVKFQNGDPLKASDVVFSYRRAMKNPRFNYLTSMITDVAAVNDGTVKVTLNKPYSPIAHTFFCVKVLSEKEVTGQGPKFGTIPNKAGTGPYCASNYTIATGLKLEAWSGYWRGAPAIKNVEYVVIPDDTSAVIAYQNGELDYLEDTPLSAWKDVSKAAGDHGKLIKGNNIMFMAVNYLSPGHKALANQKVREAIFYAVNKHDINLAVCDGYGMEATQYMPSEYVPASPSTGFKTYAFDPAKAKKLLAEAGFPKGVDVGAIMTYGTSTSNNAKMAQVLQANLADVGINATVSVAEAAIVTPKLYNQDYDICVFSDSGNYDYNNIRQQVHSESKGMYVIKYQGGPFDWKKLETLCDQGAAISDTDKRRAIYTQLWSLVMDSATILPCLHRPVGVVWSKRLDIGQPVPTYYKIRTFSLK
jgi:peptide/nickel transport system substrate-binding protein